MRKKILLIADDDRTLHDFYLELFGEDFEVMNAYDGAEALMLAVEHVPDVMLLDVAMPLLDGRALCAKLKKFPSTQGIKVVMVTGKASQYDRVVGFEVGADDYIEKPAYPEQLSRVVRSLAGHPGEKACPHAQREGGEHALRVHGSRAGNDTGCREGREDRWKEAMCEAE